MGIISRFGANRNGLIYNIWPESSLNSIQLNTNYSIISQNNLNLISAHKVRNEWNCSSGQEAAALG